MATCPPQVIELVGLLRETGRKLPFTGAKENKAGWSGFLAHLKHRGLGSVQLVISDARFGLVDRI